MADTNFAALTTEQLTVWSRDFWRVARNKSFINQFSGTSQDAMIQKVTELTKDKKGTRAVLTLLADMQSDGVTGDNVLENNEEALRSYDITIEMDQLRNANRRLGRLSDQKSVVTFRKVSRDKLAYWMGDRCDQMAFLTMSGVPYTLHTNGALRPVRAAGQNLSELEFASDVSAPTANRHLRYSSATGTLVAGDTTAMVAGDRLTYKALVRAKAYAKDNYIRPIREDGGIEFYHAFVTPSQMADLKLDPDFLQNIRNAGVRGEKNQIFKGTASFMLDGIMIHEFRHVFNTANATAGTSSNAGDAGYKWGADADVDGARMLICGAQALGFADIGIPGIEEEHFDYKNKHGISVGKIMGFRKPKFHSDYNNSVEDFGVLCVDTAQG